MRYQLNAFCLAQNRTKVSIINRIDLVKCISIYDKWLYIHTAKWCLRFVMQCNHFSQNNCHNEYCYTWFCILGRNTLLYRLILHHIKLSYYIEGIILKEVILYRYFRHELSMSKIRVSLLPLNAVLIKDTRSLAVLPHSIHSASEYEAGMEF